MISAMSSRGFAIEHARPGPASAPAPAAGSRRTGADAAIEVRGLYKRYGGFEAVRGIDFTVGRGEVFGLLGPNGAGKTTTVEILEGYRPRSEGTVTVLGFDPGQRPRALRERVGIVLQSTGIYPHITVREALTHWAGFYPHPREVDEVIALAGLEGKQDERARRLSGGQLRRLDFALALVGDPELIFLDEPTTGFDPAARRAAWDTVRSLRDLGKTVLLTTHYLDEAQALADHVAIIKDGRILAEGSPSELGVDESTSYRISYRDAGGELVSQETDDPTALLHELTGAALARGERLRDLSVVRPSLEDVYLQLTADSPARDAGLAAPAGTAAPNPAGRRRRRRRGGARPSRRGGEDAR
jgi:ABC-2 type transport system ATP-binding protein